MALTVDLEFDRGRRSTYHKSLSDTPLTISNWSKLKAAAEEVVDMRGAGLTQTY